MQPGNSGGPLVDVKGNVLGVVVAQLNDLVALRSSGSLPQNVNYAVKGKYIHGLLVQHPEVKTAPENPTVKPEEVVQKTQESVAMVLVY